MHGPEQVNAYHLRYTARIALICLVHLRLQKSLCVSRLNAHDWEVWFGKPVKEPLRQRAGLEANPFKLKRRILEHPQHMKFATRERIRNTRFEAHRLMRYCSHPDFVLVVRHLSCPLPPASDCAGQPVWSTQFRRWPRRWSEYFADKRRSS